MSINIVYSINKKRRSWRLSIQTHLLIDLLALTDHENHIKGDKVSFRHDNVSFQSRRLFFDFGLSNIS